MPTPTTKKILALEKLADDARDLVERAIYLNEAIRAHKLQIPLVDFRPLFEIQACAQSILAKLELSQRTAANSRPALRVVS